MKITGFFKSIPVTIQRKRIVRKYGAYKSVLFLDPSKDYDPAIVGVTDDKLHLIYDFDKMAENISENYSEFYHKHPEKLADIGEEADPDEVDYYTMAVEWIEYNTIRSLPYYYDNNGPVVRYVDYDNDGEYTYSNEEYSGDEEE